MGKHAENDDSSAVGPVNGSRPITADAKPPTGLDLEQSLSRLEPPRHRLVPVERSDVHVERSEKVSVERSDLEGGGQSEMVRIERTETVFDKQSDSVRIERTETVRVERIHAPGFEGIPELVEPGAYQQSPTDKAYGMLDEVAEETPQLDISPPVSSNLPDRPPPRPAKPRRNGSLEFDSQAITPTRNGSSSSESNRPVELLRNRASQAQPAGASRVELPNIEPRRIELPAVERLRINKFVNEKLDPKAGLPEVKRVRAEPPRVERGGSGERASKNGSRSVLPVERDVEADIAESTASRRIEVPDRVYDPPVGVSGLDRPMFGDASGKPLSNSENQTTFDVPRRVANRRETRVQEQSVNSAETAAASASVTQKAADNTGPIDLIGVRGGAEPAVPSQEAQRRDDSGVAEVDFATQLNEAVDSPGINGRVPDWIEAPESQGEVLAVDLPSNAEGAPRVSGLSPTPMPVSLPSAAKAGNVRNGAGSNGASKPAARMADSPLGPVPVRRRPGLESAEVSTAVNSGASPTRMSARRPSRPSVDGVPANSEPQSTSSANGLAVPEVAPAPRPAQAGGAAPRTFQQPYQSGSVDSVSKSTPALVPRRSMSGDFGGQQNAAQQDDFPAADPTNIDDYDAPPTTPDSASPEPVEQYQDLFDEYLDDPLGFFAPSAEYDAIPEQSLQRTNSTRMLQAPQQHRNERTRDANTRNGTGAQQRRPAADDSALRDGQRPRSRRPAQERSDSRAASRPRQGRRSEEWSDDDYYYDDESSHERSSSRGLDDILRSKLVTAVVAVVVVVVVGLSLRYAFSVSGPDPLEGEVQVTQDSAWWVDASATRRSFIPDSCRTTLESLGASTRAVEFSELEPIPRVDLPCDQIITSEG